MTTVPGTGTRHATEFRLEISHRVGGFLAATPVRDKSAREEFPTGHERADAGGTGRRFRRQLPAQQQCGSAAANPMNEAFAGRTRRASFIRPPPVTSRPSLDLAAMTRGDPPRIGRVKRNVRTPPDPGQPTGAAPTETADTPKARFMPKTVRSGRFGEKTRGAGHRRSRPHGPRTSRNSPSNNKGSGAYAHTMPTRGSSWSADARSTSCASPAPPVASAPDTRHSPPSIRPGTRQPARSTTSPTTCSVMTYRIPAGPTPRLSNPF